MLHRQAVDQHNVGQRLRGDLGVQLSEPILLWHLLDLDLPLWVLLVQRVNRRANSRISVE